jgi:hypothetical protein
MSFTARSVHGSAPWRMTNFSSGKNQQTSSMSATSCTAMGTRGPGTPAQTQIGMSSSTHFAYSG